MFTFPRTPLYHHFVTTLWDWTSVCVTLHHWTRYSELCVTFSMWTAYMESNAGNEKASVKESSSLIWQAKSISFVVSLMHSGQPHRRWWMSTKCGRTWSYCRSWVERMSAPFSKNRIQLLVTLREEEAPPQRLLFFNNAKVIATDRTSIPPKKSHHDSPCLGHQRMGINRSEFHFSSLFPSSTKDLRSGVTNQWTVVLVQT